MRKKALGLFVSLMALSLVACGNKNANENNKPADNNEPTAAPTEEAKQDDGAIREYEGYKLMWNDEFDGDKLNTADWNYEVHEKGWVNNEWQEYIESDTTVYLKDGKLVIKPIKDGSNYYSGRVNTQGKHDFKYGRFEARCKVPEGQGYLPAFWMMPTDESLYGQWPKCGEIDIMEVMGQKTNQAYCTVHYGSPHKENQGTYKAELGHDFAAEFHTYAVEWEPGKLTWFIDDHKVFTTNDWFTKTEGQGTITYPAPFDQPFYVIFNLAIGGEWVGYPDEAADADMANQTYEIDYVRIYQKDSYDENVKLEEKIVEVREPNEDGNFVNNGDFSVSMDDDKNWEFKLTQDGVGKAYIKDGQMVIESTSDGKVDYSVQLVQANIPFVKGGTYKITFDAYASEDRTTKIAVKAPDNGWVEYFTTTQINLTTEKQSYEFNFSMKDPTDANGRLEFNNGASGSTGTIYIENVRIERTDNGENISDAKEVLADGNYVYNGKFQEGDDRVGFWEFENADKGNVVVTGLDDSRRLSVTVKDTPIKVFQTELGVKAGTAYLFTFEAQGAKDSVIKANILGKETEFTLTGAKDNFSMKIDVTSEKEIADPSVSFTFEAEGTTCIDNVMLQEDVLLKNGDFASDFSGYTVYVDSQADAAYGIDSLTAGNDKACEFTVKKTGGDDWRVQLKQPNIKLEKGKTYKLTWDARSDYKRHIRVILQGEENRGWAVYSTDNIVILNGDMQWQHFEKEFTMEADSDPKAFLSICMGYVTAEINETHKIDIDNITLTEVE